MALIEDEYGCLAIDESLCTKCGKPKNDSNYHLDTPGTNWGAALHWFEASEKV